MADNKSQEFIELEQLTKDMFEEVRRNFFYPNLNKIELVENLKDSLCDTAGINMENYETRISKNFIDELKKGGLTEKEGLRSVLSHEIDHYMYCPFDLRTQLKLVYEIGKIANPSAERYDTDAKTITLLALYNDLVVNLHLMMKKKNTDIEKLVQYGYNKAKGMKQDNRIWDVIHSYYQFQTGNNFGAEVKDDLLIKKLERLKGIDFFDRPHQVENGKKFARIMEDLIEEKNMGNIGKNMFDQFSSKAYSKNDMENAIRELAKDYENPEDFKKILEKTGIQKELEERENAEKKAQAKQQVQGRKAGRGPGNEVIPDYYYYARLAENYPIKIKELQLSKNNSMYPYAHKRWELDDGVNNMDVFNSFGKILPGITQGWLRIEDESFDTGKNIPNSVIGIDSSGSMVNPVADKSYAVLGAICAARAYMMNGASVAVYNFSDGAKTFDFSRDENEVYKNLSTYIGGGTHFDIPAMDRLVKNSANMLDIIIITDTEIWNVDEFMNYLGNLKNRNRVTLVYTYDSGNVQTIKKKYGMQENFSIYSVKQADDIPKIVIGEVNKSF